MYEISGDDDRLCEGTEITNIHNTHRMYFWIIIKTHRVPIILDYIYILCFWWFGVSAVFRSYMFIYTSTESQFRIKAI